MEMDYNLEYYIIQRENNESYPLLVGDYGCPYYGGETEYIENPPEMNFHIGDPVPKNPKIVDYHPTPYSVISQKIYDILSKIPLNKVQFISANIMDKYGNFHENYYYIHVYNNLFVLDREKSIYDWDEYVEEASFIDKLVLDDNVLGQLPLKDRLIFRLGESNVYELYHSSVVDAIMATNPEGIRFTKVSDWTIGTAFD